MFDVVVSTYDGIHEYKGVESWEADGGNLLLLFADGRFRLYSLGWNDAEFTPVTDARADE
jgi:hypothetical protein